jgi:hypothetical protein
VASGWAKLAADGEYDWRGELVTTLLIRGPSLSDMSFGCQLRLCWKTKSESFLGARQNRGFARMNLMQQARWQWPMSMATPTIAPTSKLAVLRKNRRRR